MKHDHQLTTIITKYICLLVFFYGLFRRELSVHVHRERYKYQNTAIVQSSNCQRGGVHYILYVLFERYVALYLAQILLNFGTENHIQPVIF